MPGIYLNDHFADATAGTELAHRMARSHQNRELEETSDLQRLAVEISQDRATCWTSWLPSASHARPHDEPAAQDERAMRIRVITAPLSASCRSAAVAHSASSGLSSPVVFIPAGYRAGRGVHPSRAAGCSRNRGRLPRKAGRDPGQCPVAGGSRWRAR
jgi:hypothetical protein